MIWVPHHSIHIYRSRHFLGGSGPCSPLPQPSSSTVLHIGEAEVHVVTVCPASVCLAAFRLPPPCKSASWKGHNGLLLLPDPTVSRRRFPVGLARILRELDGCIVIHLPQGLLSITVLQRRLLRPWKTVAA